MKAKWIPTLIFGCIIASAYAGDAIKYYAAVVRVGQPFTFRAEGVSSGNWSLQNVEGGDYDIHVIQGARYVSVTLTVRSPFVKYAVPEDLVAAPMLVWEDPVKSVRLALKVIGAKAKEPTTAKPVRTAMLRSKRVHVLPFAVDGDWGRRKPLIYVP